MRKLYYSGAAILAALISSFPALDARAEEWGESQTGYLRDDVVTESYIMNTFYEFPVEMQESKETPGRWRLVNAYKNCPSVGGAPFPEEAVNYLVVDASDPVHVYIEPGGTSYYIGVGQQLCLWSIADDYYNNKYGNWNQADSEGVCGTLADGAITFPKGAVLWNPIECDVFEPSKYDLIWKGGNMKGMFRILLPGTPRTDIELSLMGQSDDQKSVNYYVVLDEDIDYANAALFEGEYTPDMVQKVIDAAAGNASDVEVKKIDASGIVSFPYTKDGFWTLVAVPYAEKKAWPAAHYTREFAYSEEVWKNVGNAEYTETILSSNELRKLGFAISEYTYNVPVQQKVNSPWLLRLVDPYSDKYYPYATSTIYDDSSHHYLYFNLGDFDNCVLEYTADIGLRINNYGEISVWSYSDRGAKGQLSQAFLDMYYPDGVPTGKFDAATNVLTFEPNALNVLFGANPGAWYMANNNGNFLLKFAPEIKIEEDPIAGAAVVESDCDAAPEFFSLSGARLSAEPSEGAFIVKRGAKVSKVIK